MNPQYEAHERLCKSIGDMAKENEDLKHHVTELENRLRALWDKLEYERKHYMEQVRRLEEAGNNLLWNFCPEYTSDFTESQSDALKQWNKAKEAKP
jgi:predicted  nucleic acid-binding Zn-ribbon protein